MHRWSHEIITVAILLQISWCADAQRYNTSLSRMRHFCNVTLYESCFTIQENNGHAFNVSELERNRKYRLNFASNSSAYSYLASVPSNNIQGKVENNSIVIQGPCVRYLTKPSEPEREKITEAHLHNTFQTFAISKFVQYPSRFLYIAQNALAISVENTISNNIFLQHWINDTFSGESITMLQNSFEINISMHAAPVMRCAAKNKFIEWTMQDLSHILPLQMCIPCHTQNGEDTSCPAHYCATDEYAFAFNPCRALPEDEVLRSFIRKVSVHQNQDNACISTDFTRSIEDYYKDTIHDIYMDEKDVMVKIYDFTRTRSSEIVAYLTQHEFKYHYKFAAFVNFVSNSPLITIQFKKTQVPVLPAKTNALSPPATTPTSSTSETNSTVLIAVGSVVGVLALLVVFVACTKTQNSNSNKNKRDAGEVMHLLLPASV